jgi:hypothetical protein
MVQRRAKVTKDDLALAVANLHERLKRIERWKGKRDREPQDMVIQGFRLSQDDEDADYTPEEVRRRR